MRRSANMARSYHCRASKRSRQLGGGQTSVLRNQAAIRPNFDVRAHYYRFDRVDRVGRSARARGGADNCGHDQENFRYTDSHSAKEKNNALEKEIVQPDAEPGKEIFPESYAHGFAATEKETFAHTHAGRDTGEIDNTNSKSNAFGAIEEKTFAYTHAERDPRRIGITYSNSNAFSHTDADARNLPLGITEKAWRAQRKPDPGPNQRLRKLFDRRAETSRLRARTDQAQSRL